jgi:mRNA-degrading endonuclease RelE of RelBE toxin-antitoxin system
MHKVTMKNKVLKSLRKMPVAEQKKFAALVVDLEADGPIQPSWPNYSKLGDNDYHCHLSYKWVACWKNEENSIIVEVYYAGSRENAPY